MRNYCQRLSYLIITVTLETTKMICLIIDQIKSQLSSAGNTELTKHLNSIGSQS